MPRDWSKTSSGSSFSANRCGVGGRIASLAARQRDLLRSEDLLGAGLSPSGTRSRVAAGRLFRIHAGVFSLSPPPYSNDQRLLAAVYACGTGSMVSDWSLAALRGLIDHHPPLIEITNAGGRGRRRRGIILHRRQVDPRDRAGYHGIPCTSAARMLIDVAPRTPLSRLEDLLIAVDSVQILNRRRLEELLAERRGQPGTAKLLGLIREDPVELRSINEARLFSICREFGVARPLVNHRIDLGDRHFYADFCWPELGLIVEADSWRWHGGRSAAESDADRDQLLSIAGWKVVHFTRDQIVNRRAETGRRLVALTFPPAS